MKIKFNSDNELPLNKTIEIYSMIIVARAKQILSTSFLRWMSKWNIKMESKVEHKKLILKIVGAIILMI